MDYSTLMLTEKEQAIFKKFKHSDSAYLTRDEFQSLRNKNLVTGLLNGKSDWFDIPDSGICALSQKGLEYKAYMHEQERQKRIKRIEYWIPILIANLLSIIAIVISILK